MKVKYEFEIESKDCMKCPMCEEKKYKVIGKVLDLGEKRDYTCLLTGDTFIEKADARPEKVIRKECPLEVVRDGEIKAEIKIDGEELQGMVDKAVEQFKKDYINEHLKETIDSVDCQGR